VFFVTGEFDPCSRNIIAEEDYGSSNIESIYVHLQTKSVIQFSQEELDKNHKEH
jgi:hypothetical protein